MNDFAGYAEIKRRHVGNGHDAGAEPLEPLIIVDPTTLDAVPVPDRPWLVQIGRAHV